MVPLKDSMVSFRSLDLKETYFPMIACAHSHAFFGLPPSIAIPPPNSEVSIDSVKDKTARDSKRPTERFEIRWAGDDLYDATPTPNKSGRKSKSANIFTKSELSLKIHSLEKKIMEKECLLQKADLAATSFRNQIENKDSLLNDTKLTISTQQEQLSGKEEKINRIDKMLADKEFELGEEIKNHSCTRLVLATIKDDLNEAKVELQRSKEVMDATEQELRGKLQQQSADSVQELKESAARLAMCNFNLELARKTLKDKEEALSAQRAELEKAKTSLESLRNSHQETNSDQTQNTNHLYRRITALEEQNTDLQRDSSARKTSLDNFRVQVDELRDKNFQLEEDLRKTKGNLKTATELAASLASTNAPKEVAIKRQVIKEENSNETESRPTKRARYSSTNGSVRDSHNRIDLTED
jgi:chromosome segregation ATPase